MYLVADVSSLLMYHVVVHIVDCCSAVHMVALWWCRYGGCGACAGCLCWPLRIPYFTLFVKARLHN